MNAQCSSAGNDDDVVSGGIGNDDLNGGNGFDTAVFAGSITDFSWAAIGGGFVVTDLNAADGDEGVDTVISFEEMQFDDFTLNIDGGNNAPLILDDGPTTDEDNALAFSVSAYDFDGDAMTLDSFTYNGTLGTLALDSTSAFTPAMGTGLSLNFTFDPGADYQSLAVGDTVVETVSVTVSDGNGGTTVHNFDITINGVNDDPTMAAGAAAATEDGPTVDVDLAVLGDDIDNDNDGSSLIYTITGSPGAGEGSASITGTTLTFDPGADFQGLALGETQDVVITVTVTDAHGATASNDITVTVTGTNDDPTMAAGFANATEDGATVDVDLAALGDDIDSDDDGSSLIYAITGSPGAGEGSASITGTTLTYDPGADFQGLALGETQDVVITVTVTDAHGATASNDITVTVTGTNDDPTMLAGFGAATEDGPTVDVDLAALGDDVDSDNDGTNLIYTIIGILSEGGASISGNTLTFDPGADFQNLAAGETRDVVITVQAEDAHGATTTADITITVTGTNDAPTLAVSVAATEDSNAAVVDLSLYGDDVDSDDDGTTLTHTLVTGPSEGTATVDGTMLTFDPGTDFQDLGVGETRDVTVTIEVTDSHGETTTEVVTITVTGTNDDPIAQDSSQAATEGAGSIVIDLNALVNDVDVNDVLSLSVLSITDNTGRGIVVPFTLVNGVVTIDPAEFGLDAAEVEDFVLTYLVDDGNGGTSTGEITLTVTGIAGDPTPPTNNAPIASDLEVTADEADGMIFIDLNALVSDADTGDTLTITSVMLQDDGHATPVVFTVVNGVIQIDPAQFGLDEGQSIIQSFEFTVDDGSGATNSSTTGTVELTIEGADDPLPPNNAPVANDLVLAAVNEDAGMISIDLNTLISDPDTGDVLSIGAISFTQGGVEISVNYTIAGGVVFIDPEQFGLDTGESFTGILNYTVDDGSGAANSSANGEVTFSVDGADETETNNAPVTVDQLIDVDLDASTASVTFDLAGFASDIDTGDVLAFSNFSFTYTVEGEGGPPETFNVVFTIDGTEITFDPTQFGLLDGEQLSLVFTYEVDDGSGASNSSSSGSVFVNVEDPAVVPPPTGVGEYLLDFEPFADESGFSVGIGTYEEFVFNGDVQVFETDEATSSNGRPGGLPQGVFNGVVSGDNVLAMEADGSLTIGGAGTGVEGVDNVGTFNLDSIYLTSSVTEGMTVTFTTFEEVFVSGVGLVLQEVGSFDFVVGTTGMGAGGTSGGNIFIDFDALIDPTTGDPLVDSAIFNDLASVSVTTDAGAGNLLVIDDIGMTVVTDPVFNLF
ncbi:MAG: hypothetical protein GY952_03305 [Rhodobacteraceae bacterium]|nr:hypothetical protein [Paracoccaceae bacterium]